MSVTKKILKHPFTQSVLCFIGAIAIRALFWTNRREWVIPEAARPYLYEGTPFIIAFWHGRLLMQPYMRPKKQKAHVLISGHKDGMIISKVISWFGIGTITGSSSKGGTEAFKQMLKTAKAGDTLCITPDGPRGPIQQAAAGIAHTAKYTGLPVVPYSFSASRHKRLSSWDKFMVPLPFGKICFIAAPPIFVDRRADDDTLEQKRREIESVLNAITEDADARCGVAPFTPSGL